jgi:TRAP-type C4-dicarboxylate transport system permease large subunit
VAAFLILILLHLMLGTFPPPSEIILVTVPVLLPVAQAVGIHPIHFGMASVIASAVGHITLPVGLCLFVGMAISGLPMEKLVKPLLPFLAAIVVTLLLVAFISETVLIGPRMLGFIRLHRHVSRLQARQNSLVVIDAVIKSPAVTPQISP